jgi:hypothetical protein
MKTSGLDILKFDRRKDSKYFHESRVQSEGILDCRSEIVDCGTEGLRD